MFSKVPLTEKQREVLVFIHDYQTEYGFAPTTREIMHEFGWASPQAVVCHRLPLEKKGFLTHCSRAARSFVLTPKALLELESDMVDTLWGQVEIGEAA